MNELPGCVVNVVQNEVAVQRRENHCPECVSNTTVQERGRLTFGSNFKLGILVRALTGAGVCYSPCTSMLNSIMIK